MSIKEKNTGKLNSAHYFEHILELEAVNKKGKHTMYNALLRLFRKKGIKCQTLNNRIIIANGLLDGLWFTPNGKSCYVTLAMTHPKHGGSFGRKVGVSGMDLVVDYSLTILFDKLKKFGIISAGTHLFLTTSERD